MGFSTLGAAYGMAKACIGVMHLARLAPSAVLRGMIPVVMAGVSPTVPLLRYIHLLYCNCIWTPLRDMLWGHKAMTNSYGCHPMDVLASKSWGLFVAFCPILASGRIPPPPLSTELLAIYGFISSLNIAKNLDIAQYSSWAGYLDLASGLVVGLSGLAAGITIGTIGEANVRCAFFYAPTPGLMRW